MVLSKDLKIAICFGLIMGAILSVCNLCFAVEPNFVSVSGLGINTSGEIVNNSGSSVYYLEIEPGYEYILEAPTSTSYGRRIGFTNDNVSVGVQLENFEILDSGEGFSFNSNIYRYAVFAANGPFNITRRDLQGMSGFINDILYSLSVGELSSVWILVVPILAISVLFGLGFYLLKRLLNKIKRAKGGA